jgi:hypothetical protein
MTSDSAATIADLVAQYVGTADESLQSNDAATSLVSSFLSGDESQTNAVPSQSQALASKREQQSDVSTYKKPFVRVSVLSISYQQKYPSIQQLATQQDLTRLNKFMHCHSKSGDKLLSGPEISNVVESVTATRNKCAKVVRLNPAELYALLHAPGTKPGQQQQSVSPPSPEPQISPGFVIRNGAIGEQDALRLACAVRDWAAAQPLVAGELD